MACAGDHVRKMLSKCDADALFYCTKSTAREREKKHLTPQITKDNGGKKNKCTKVKQEARMNAE